MNETDNAGVKVLPPVVMLLCAGAAIAAEALFALPRLTAENPAVHILGFFIVVASGILGASGVRVFLVSKVNPVPTKPVSRLLTSGIYRYTRNPMYVGIVALFAGVALIFDSFAFLAAAAVMFAYFQFYVIPREEAYMTRTFWGDYTAYCTRVRRWF